MDDLDNLISEVSGGTVKPDNSVPDSGTTAPVPASTAAPKAAPQAQEKPAAQPSEKNFNKTEFFPEAEYENEEDPDFDISKIPLSQRNVWPKKFLNALAYRDQELTKLKTQLAGNAARPQEQGNPANPQQAAGNNAAAVEANPQTPQYTAEEQSKLSAVEKRKPDLAKFEGNYGEYQEALMDWKVDMRDAQNAIANNRLKESQANEVEIEQNTNRIITQSKALIEKRPELLNLVLANAPILDSYPPHVLNAFAAASNPELVFLGLASSEGALQRLALMNPQQAAMFIGQAQQFGMTLMGQQGDAADADGANEQPQIPQKPVSNAPTPMRAARGTGAGGAQTLEKLEGDDLMKALNIDGYN